MPLQSFSPFSHSFFPSSLFFLSFPLKLISVEQELRKGENWPPFFFLSLSLDLTFCSIINNNTKNRTLQYSILYTHCIKNTDLTIHFSSPFLLLLLFSSFSFSPSSSSIVLLELFRFSFPCIGVLCIFESPSFLHPPLINFISCSLFSLPSFGMDSERNWKRKKLG